MSQDHIRQSIIDRAAMLGLSAYAIAKQCDLDPQTVKRYFDGKQQVSSEKASVICELLGLQLRTKRFRKAKTLVRTKK